MLNLAYGLRMPDSLFSSICIRKAHRFILFILSTKAYDHGSLLRAGAGKRAQPEASPPKESPVGWARFLCPRANKEVLYILIHPVNPAYENLKSSEPALGRCGITGAELVVVTGEADRRVLSTDERLRKSFEEIRG